MADDIDWSLTTWEGNRRIQHREFLALSFREKLDVIEGLGELAARLGRGSREQGSPRPPTRTGRTQ